MIDGHTLGYWWDEYWWVLILVWAFGGSVWESVVHWNRKRIRDRRKHQLRLETIRATSARLNPPVPVPGPCRHRKVVSVRDPVDDHVIAWLCKSCDTQLPADWAVYPEDL